jgi:hypothetical protein
MLNLPGWKDAPEALRGGPSEGVFVLFIMGNGILLP